MHQSIKVKVLIVKTILSSKVQLALSFLWCSDKLCV